MSSIPPLGPINRPGINSPSSENPQKASSSPEKEKVQAISSKIPTTPPNPSQAQSSSKPRETRQRTLTSRQKQQLNYLQGVTKALMADSKSTPPKEILEGLSRMTPQRLIPLMKQDEALGDLTGRLMELYRQSDRGGVEQQYTKKYIENYLEAYISIIKEIPVFNSLETESMSGELLFKAFEVIYTTYEGDAHEEVLGQELADSLYSRIANAFAPEEAEVAVKAGLLIWPTCILALYHRSDVNIPPPKNAEASARKDVRTMEKEFSKHFGFDEPVSFSPSMQIQRGTSRKKVDQEKKPDYGKDRHALSRFIKSMSDPSMMEERLTGQWERMRQARNYTDRV